jgi:SAM-dependent methyltransferase
MQKYGNYDNLSILAELYDFVPLYANRSDLDFYVQYGKATSGDILELGCGTGRVLLPVAEAGCRITGLDLSEHMLAGCRRKLQFKSGDVQGRVRLAQGNMTDFSFKQVFELVIIAFRPFQDLIEVNDQLSCLRCINRHLATKGKLIIDVFQTNLKILNDPRLGEEIEDLAEFELPDGRRFSRTYRITALHRAKQYNDIELIYYLTDTEGKTERIVHAFPFHYFFRYEMEHLLARCGFEVVDLFGDFDGSPLADDSPEMIFVSQKVREPA